MKRHDLAVKAYRYVKKLLPEEPQSWRDLALALVQRADATADQLAKKQDYQEALDLFAEIVKRKWDRFEDIELIALNELMGTWQRAEKMALRSGHPGLGYGSDRYRPLGLRSHRRKVLLQ